MHTHIHGAICKFRLQFKQRLWNKRHSAEAVIGQRAQEGLFVPAAERPQTSPLPAFDAGYRLNILSKTGIRKMKYRVHRFNIKMTRDQSELEQFLNSLKGEVISIVPNVTIGFMWVPQVDFLLIVEKIG